MYFYINVISDKDRTQPKISEIFSLLCDADTLPSPHSFPITTFCFSLLVHSVSLCLSISLLYSVRFLLRQPEATSDNIGCARAKSVLTFVVRLVERINGEAFSGISNVCYIAPLAWDTNEE